MDKANTDKLDDWDKFNLEQLLAAAQQAISRARYTFMALMIASILLLAEVFNTHYAWIRNPVQRAEKKNSELVAQYGPEVDLPKNCPAVTNQIWIHAVSPPTTNPCGAVILTTNDFTLCVAALPASPSSNQATNYPQSYVAAIRGSFPSPENLALLKEVMQKDLYLVSVPLLGIRFSDFDLPILGALGMSVILIWNIFTLRRETGVIKAIKKYADEGLDKHQDGIQNGQTKKPQSATPENKLRYQALYNGVAHRFILVQVRNPSEDPKEDHSVGLAGPFLVLQYMPALVIFLGVLSDIYSVFDTSVVAGPGANISLWDTMFVGEKREFLSRSLIACGAGSLCLWMCNKCVNLHKQTAETVSDMSDTIKELSKTQ